jgi:hypothetical protein
MKSIVLALFILMASAVQSSAQVVRSGNDIQEACEILIQSGGPKGDVESAKAGFCLGFVTALLFTGRWLARTGQLFSSISMTTQTRLVSRLRF